MSSRSSGKLGLIWTFVPFLIFPLLIYIFIALFSQSMNGALNASLFELTMLSGGVWRFEVGEALLAFAMGCLFLEVVKSTSTRRSALLNHGLSVGLLVICLIVFLCLKHFATSEFFLIMLMVGLDVVAGFIVSIVAARRDFGVGDGFIQ